VYAKDMFDGMREAGSENREAGTSESV
jgi:hypothetical protein